MVEPISNFCTQKYYEFFMSQINEFEKMFQESGIHLIKLYFSMTKTEQ
ncbi:hypothetical protein [Psychroserpens sp.]